MKEVIEFFEKRIKYGNVKQFCLSCNFKTRNMNDAQLEKIVDYFKSVGYTTTSIVTKSDKRKYLILGE